MRGVFRSALRALRPAGGQPPRPPRYFRKGEAAGRLEGVDVALGAGAVKVSLEFGEAVFGDRRTHPCHEVLVVMEIVPCEQHRGDDFLRAEDMVQIGAAVILARGATAVFVERARVVLMAMAASSKYVVTIAKP